MSKNKYIKYLSKNENLKKIRGGKFVSFDISSIKSVDVLNSDEKKYKGEFLYYNNINITTLLDEKIIFQYEKEISCGTHGCVFLYKSSTDENVKLTCKYPKIEDGLEDDIKIINLLKFCSEYYISSYIYIHPDSKTEFILMNYMDGDLSNFFSKDENCNLNTIIKIMKFLIDALECLYSNGLCYTDMKKPNVLYKLEDDGLKLLLCDLGSATEIGKEGIASYPSIYHYDGKEYKKCKNCGVFDVYEPDIVWSLGITILSFMENHSVKTRKYGWDIIERIVQLDPNYEKNIELEINKDIELFCDYFFKDKQNEPYKINHVKTTLKRMLTIHPSNRITLKNLKELFNFHFDETPKFLGA